jgi:hypothetical protein
MINKITLYLFLSIICFFYNIVFIFGQRGYDDYDYEEYNWKDFNSSNFVLAAIICALVIGSGIYLQKNQSNTLYHTIGKILVWIGGIGAFVSLGGPVLGAIGIIWKVGLGIAIFIGILTLFGKKDS